MEYSFDKVIYSISGLLSILEQLQYQYGSSRSSETFLFRGHSSEKFSLLPSYFRNFPEECKARYIDGSIDGIRYRCDDEEILAHFKSEACGILNTIPYDDDFTWMQYAQHYGVPTRLLDLTSNPLVALYFCCKSESEENGAVWIIHHSNYIHWMFQDQYCLDNPDITKYGIQKAIIDQVFHHDDSVNLKMKRPYIYIARYIDQRMAAQSSRFLMWGDDVRPLEEIISLHEIMELATDGSKSSKVNDTRFLMKVIVDGDSKHDILRELDLLGINEKTIFPGLDGIGRYIEKYYLRNPDDILEYDI